MNTKLMDVLFDFGAKHMHPLKGSGNELETKAVSAKLLYAIIKTIQDWHGKSDNVRAAVKVDTENEGPMKNWCKIIQLDDYDVLVRKDYNEEKEGHALNFQIYHIEKGLNMSITILCGSEAKMNESFENISKEGTDVFAKQMTKFL